MLAVSDCIQSKTHNAYGVSSLLLSGNNGWATGPYALLSNGLVHSVTSTQGEAGGQRTATWPVVSVAERSGSALRNPEVYSAYINMKNQCVNEHTCFHVPKLAASDRTDH